MKKIGILTCIHANEVCTGAGCLKAFHGKTDFFQDYSADTQLAAFMTCNGCSKERPQEPGEDPGILEKVDRLVKEEITAMHMGVCRMTKEKKECGRITEICRLIEEKGIQVIRGTHKE